MLDSLMHSILKQFGLTTIASAREQAIHALRDAGKPIPGSEVLSLAIHGGSYGFRILYERDKSQLQSDSAALGNALESINYIGFAERLSANVVFKIEEKT
jgi:hypothetical protein